MEPKKASRTQIRPDLKMSAGRRDSDYTDAQNLYDSPASTFLKWSKDKPKEGEGIEVGRCAEFESNLDSGERKKISVFSSDGYSNELMSSDANTLLVRNPGLSGKKGSAMEAQSHVGRSLLAFAVLLSVVAMVLSIVALSNSKTSSSPSQTRTAQTSSGDDNPGKKTLRVSFGRFLGRNPDRACAAHSSLPCTACSRACLELYSVASTGKSVTFL